MNRDFMENEVKVGSRIVYATSYGSGGKLTEGEVVEIRERKEGERGPAFKLVVQPFRDSRGFRWSTNPKWDPDLRKHIPQKKATKVTLQHTDRFAVLD